VSKGDNQILVSVQDSDQKTKALHGLYRALIANMVTGVSRGFEKVLDIVGVGTVRNWPGERPRFTWIFSPSFLNFLRDQREDRKTRITLKGIDKELLADCGHHSRLQKAGTLQGKGIKYADEVIRRRPEKPGPSKIETALK